MHAISFLSSKSIKDRHRTYNATLRSVRATIVAVEKQQELLILIVCLQTLLASMHCACPILSWCLLGCTKFYILSRKRHDFRNIYWTQNLRFDFLYNSCLKHFLFWEELSEMWQTRQAMYVKRNIVARSCNHCRCGKAISVTYCECGCSLSYPACNAYAPYCHLWPSRLYNIFPHYLTIGTI